MVDRKSRYGILFLLIVCIPYLWAGDTATFVDLGFSPDGTVYMFGQYGIQARTFKPWAELYGVDIARNDFVSGGRQSYTHDSPAIPGQDGSGAFFRLISRNSALADRYGINFLFQGISLYISIENGIGSSGGSETISFRDFEHGSSYTAVLTAQSEGSGPSLKSGFSIKVDRTYRDGSRKSYTAGNLQIKRPSVASYKIRRVLIAPQENSLIFVVEMRKQSADSYDLRYMVEALRL